jgi:hypothetical protein
MHIDNSQIQVIFETGIYFGYPECCINNFIDDRKKGIDTKSRNFAGNYTGFVPCKNHLDMIRNGKLKIEDLIQSRICKKPFPDHNDHNLHMVNRKIANGEPTIYD